jgi:sensor histidine kinase YesM
LSAVANVCSKDGRGGEKLILDLAQFLQTSFDFSSNEEMTTLERELSFIDNYISIEKARFGDKIVYHKQIDIPLSTEIPRLIIEPLVENAVRHGITKKKAGGAIWLRASRSDDGIHIEVDDNGVGMEPENAALLLDSAVERRGVGLKNIHDRLIKLYGQGLIIASTPDIGTKVSFVIKEGDRVVENSCS